MTVAEMDDMFEVLYNNVTSNQAPGLNAYEKSVFLTKAQDEILKNYFNSKSKGNVTQDGFDANQKRQIDFSMITNVATTATDDYTYTDYTEGSKVTDGKGNTVSEVVDGNGNKVYTRTKKASTTPADSYVQAYDKDGEPMKDENGNPLYVKNEGTNISNFGEPLFDKRNNTRSIVLPTSLMMVINEMVEVKRNDKEVILQVIPIKFDEYSRLMSKPYKRPLKFQAWRLLNSDTARKADIVVGPSDVLEKYTLRYIRRPNPIIVSNLDGLSIEGVSHTSECELDPILHEEILQRAVELAKAAWTSTGQDNLQAMMTMGQRSE